MNIVVWDTETTGLLLPNNSPLEEQPKIIEFYGVKINEEFEILDQVECFINPNEPISKEITRITGITDADVEYAKPFKDNAPAIEKLFHDCDVSVAHNIAFDNGMLSNEFKRIGVEMPRARHDLCTVEAMQDNLGFRISLTMLYKRFYGKHFKAHRAKSDVFALVSCLHKMNEKGIVDLEIYQNRI